MLFINMNDQLKKSEFWALFIPYLKIGAIQKDL